MMPSINNCKICGPATHNRADYSLSYGPQDIPINACKWCVEDFQLQHVQVNQIVQLPKPTFKQVVYRLAACVIACFQEATQA